MPTSPKSPPRTHQERSDATRAALVAAAHPLFVAKGYAETGTPELVAAAQVTRGALYHHFADKAELFFEVARQAAAEVADAIAAGSTGRFAPRDALERGAHAYFAAMAEGGRARLLLLDAPAVLSPAQLRELAEAAGENELREGLREAMREAVDGPTLEALTRLLSAAFDAAALAMAQGEPAARYKKAIRLLIDGVLR